MTAGGCRCFCRWRERKPLMMTKIYKTVYHWFCVAIAILLLPWFYLCWAVTGYEPEGKHDV